MHISIKNQSTVRFIYHITANYGSITNIPLKCQINVICPNYLTSTNVGRYANKYATYVLTGINHVIRSAVHSWPLWWQCQMMRMIITPTTKMMIPQPYCIDWVGYFAKSTKKKRFSYLLRMLTEPINFYCLPISHLIGTKWKWLGYWLVHWRE